VGKVGIGVEARVPVDKERKINQGNSIPSQGERLGEGNGKYRRPRGMRRGNSFVTQTWVRRMALGVLHRGRHEERASAMYLKRSPFYQQER